MLLNKIRIHNYKCYEEFELDFVNRLTLIVGVNGSGKSTILDACTVAVSAFLNGFDGFGLWPIRASDARIASFKMGETMDFQPQYPVEITAQGEFFGESFEWTRIRKSEASSVQSKVGSKNLIELGTSVQERIRSGEHLTLPVIAHYSTSRLWSDEVHDKDIVGVSSARQDGYRDAGCAHLKQNRMVSWFEKMTYKELKEGRPLDTLTCVRKAIEKAFASITKDESVHVEMNLDTHDIDVIHTNEKGECRLGLSQFSDGYRCTLFLIADIAYRMAQLNPHLKEHVLEETDGIVMVDEIDLHLHPAWQQIILQDLMNIFPKVQFIATSHAPAVIGSVKSESLVILKDGDAFGNDLEIFGNDANSILTDIMGVTERSPEIAEMFRKFEEDLVNLKFEEAEKILDQLEELRGTHDKQIAADRVKLKLERIRSRAV